MEGPGQEESGGQAATAPGPRRPPPAHVTRRAALPVSVGRAGQAGRPALGGLLRALPSTPCASFPAFGVFTSGVSQLSLGSNPGSATHILPVALGPGDGLLSRKMGRQKRPRAERPVGEARSGGESRGPGPGSSGRARQGGPGAARSPRGPRHAVPGTRSPRSPPFPVVNHCSQTLGTQESPACRKHCRCHRNGASSSSRTD